MTAVFKLDTEILEDVEHLHDSLLGDFAEMKVVYEHLLVKGLLPEEIPSTLQPDNFFVHEVGFDFEGVLVRIMEPYIILKNTRTHEIGVIEMYHDEDQVFAYNLYTPESISASTGEKTKLVAHKLITEMDDAIDEVFEYAEDSNFIIQYMCNTGLKDFIFSFINKMQHPGFTEADAEEICSWLGYRTITESVN